MQLLRGRRRLAALPTLLLFGSFATAAGPAQLVCNFQDPQIRESSGLAASSRSSEYFFTHNDSGDSARFFAVRRDGVTLATFRVPGAQNEDWEDMARARDPQGNPVLLFGDIGDNARKRDHVSVYQVPEPEIDATRTGVKAESARAVKFDLQYPDGPHDAETLLFNAVNGQTLVVTKDLKSSGVYASAGWLKPDQLNVLQKVSWVRPAELPLTRRNAADLLKSLLITGGDISPDGRRLVLRTYTDAFEWSIIGNDVATGLRTNPEHLVLPETPQGEAAAYTQDGKAILFSSEKEGAPVHEIARP